MGAPEGGVKKDPAAAAAPTFDAGAGVLNGVLPEVGQPGPGVDFGGQGCTGPGSGVTGCASPGNVWGAAGSIGVLAGEELRPQGLAVHAGGARDDALDAPAPAGCRGAPRAPERDPSLGTPPPPARDVPGDSRRAGGDPGRMTRHVPG
ncbi:hypothetical protein BS78_04G186500 [Paspalum vaginatum]|nr:hypothetical protein BS78_04G186500 [Paspalum vaginatum]